MKVKKISTSRGTRYVKVLDSGQYRFIKKSVYDKEKGKKTTRTTSSRASKGGSSKKMAKRKFTLPMATVMPLVGSVFAGPKQGWASPYQAIVENQDYQDGARVLMMGWTGFDLEGTDKWSVPKYPLMLIAGGIISAVASKLGVNRRLGRAGIPFIRV